MLDGEQPAGTPHAALHLVGHVEHAVLCTTRPQVGGETRWQGQEAALALHGLHHHGGHRLRRHLRDQRMIELVDAVLHVVVFTHAGRAAVGIGERQTIDFGGERAKAALEQRVLAGHAERQVGAAVIGALEYDQRMPAGVGPRHLDRRLHRLGAAVEQGGFLGEVAGDAGIEALAYLDIGRIGRDDRAHVDQTPCLVTDGIDHRWRRMTNRQGADSAGEIEKGVAIHVGHCGTVAARHGDAGETGRPARHRRIASRNKGHTVGSGHFRHELDGRHADTCCGVSEMLLYTQYGPIGKVA